MTSLDDLLTELRGRKDWPELRAKAGLHAQMVKWAANLGPQTQAYFCPADLLLYGGQGGGGKTDLLAGLAMTAHRRSLLVRRHYADLGALIERVIQINGARKGFNGSLPPKMRTLDGRLIDFGGVAHAGDEEHWQGQAHDFLGIDEVVQLLESQVRFLMGWVRSAETELGAETEKDRCRSIFATNPPVTSDGQYIIGMFRPWLDITYPEPAKPGELRWYVTDPDGKDFEVDGPEPHQFPGQARPALPQSRTFIPAALKDNPFLIDTGYQATLDSLPEPLRSAVRDGNFMAARKDAVNQVIPAAWVIAAQSRWTPSPPRGIPMCAMGVDASGGGDDPMVIAPRHDGWFAPLIRVPGNDIPAERIGRFCAGVVVSHRRDSATVVVDMGGGYGGPLFEHLRANDVECVPWKGSETSNRRTADRKLGFANKRSEMIWKFREALDPDQPGGSPIALPPDPMLMADLTAPTFEVLPRGITVEPKKSVTGRLQRSTDDGDAVCMAWTSGGIMATHASVWGFAGADQMPGVPIGRRGKTLRVIRGHENQRRR